MINLKMNVVYLEYMLIRPIDVASCNLLWIICLQHRGQESAGIAVSNGEEIKIIKD